MYTVELYNRSFDTAAPPRLTLRPVRYSSHAIGGYEYAEIAADGDPLELWEALRLLRYYVIIRNRNQSPVWCGLVTEVTINLGGITIGKTLEAMANRIAVSYTYEDASGASVQASTDWADHALSQSRYGIVEALESQSDMAPTEAEKLRDRALDLLGKPVSIVSFGGGTTGGTIHCRGLWSTLSWKIYDRPGGVERYEATGDYDHPLGWGFTGATVGFEPVKDRIHDLLGRLEKLEKDHYILVSGAANSGNNSAFRVTKGTTAEPDSYTAATISFNTTDDIQDSAKGMGLVEAYDMIKVSGSADTGNNRYYFVKSSAAEDHITVVPSTVSNSSAGSTVTIDRGNGVVLDTSLTEEFPGNTVTVVGYGTVLAQSFGLNIDDPFLLAEVSIRVKRVGSPVDSLQVALRADSSSSPSGTNIEAQTIIGANIDDDMAWVKFSFGGSTTVNYGATYWLLVSRTGANDPDNYYVVELNKEADYSGGSLKIWNGSIWVPHPLAVDMPFQAWSWMETSDQMADMLEDGDQFFISREVRSVSGIHKRQYRDQGQRTQAEIETLMAVGTTAGNRYLARVTPERAVQIYEEPTANINNDSMLGFDGMLRDVSGQQIEHGKLPTGQWIQLVGAPTNVDEAEGISTLFIERAEWDCQSEKFSALEFKGAPNPWESAVLL